MCVCVLLCVNVCVSLYVCVCVRVDDLSSVASSGFVCVGFCGWIKSGRSLGHSVGDLRSCGSWLVNGTVLFWSSPWFSLFCRSVCDRHWSMIALPRVHSSVFPTLFGPAVRFQTDFRVR